MCNIVEAPFVMMHFLKRNESCSIRKMAEIKRKIEKNVPSVYVNATRNYILAIVAGYPEIFSWEDDCVKRKETADKFFRDDVIDYFHNHDIDDSLKTEIIRCIESC